MAKMIGMSRSIKLEWLNKTVELILEGKNEKQIKDELNEYLSFEIKDPTNLIKTRGILMNIWVKTPDEVTVLKKLAIEAYKDEKANKLALHWSMMLVAYPVFSDICALIGKLTNIQDTFTASWLKEKLFEMWGEGTTLLYSSQKILQTLKQIGVIENEKIGVYRIKKYQVTDVKTIQVLLLAILYLRERAYYEIVELSSVPQVFPFEYNVSYEWLHDSNLFNLSNFGGKIVLTVD
ncbi:hypothetical protein [Anaerobranca gottschalkii]|uniref:Uncharacterized protein n=1 Tax=Anaerobranca gottschalkii DSM 13577 TaxID=1120990 RepID=A0A1H9Z2Z4_9FIRM|nr:hypothetical protein [Anaerobranca gottschalkii]SES75726.1 hypothetical protein SAMN03080614_100630 [Anaerobranca gottschalkii DSM 13577]